MQVGQKITTASEICAKFLKTLLGPNISCNLGALKEKAMKENEFFVGKVFSRALRHVGASISTFYSPDTGAPEVIVTVPTESWERMNASHDGLLEIPKKKRESYYTGGKAEQLKNSIDDFVSFLSEHGPIEKEKAIQLYSEKSGYTATKIIQMARVAAAKTYVTYWGPLDVKSGNEENQNENHENDSQKVA